MHIARAILRESHDLRDELRENGRGVSLGSQGMNIRVKRVYDPAVKADGHRVLVDRLWPRGAKKGEAQIDEWLKEIAPSTRLRKTFKHDPGRWQEFKREYWAELDVHRDRLAELARQSRKQTVTLLFAAKNIELNNAVALKEYIEQMM